MQYPAKTIPLKDGRTAVFREQGLTQLELEFIEGNERGRHLYEKMGFAVVAEKPNAIRLKDGTTLKEFFIIKEL